MHITHAAGTISSSRKYYLVGTVPHLTPASASQGAVVGPAHAAAVSSGRGVTAHQAPPDAETWQCRGDAAVTGRCKKFGGISPASPGVPPAMAGTDKLSPSPGPPNTFSPCTLYTYLHLAAWLHPGYAPSCHLQAGTLQKPGFPLAGQNTTSLQRETCAFVHFSGTGSQDP